MWFSYTEEKNHIRYCIVLAVLELFSDIQKRIVFILPQLQAN